MFLSFDWTVFDRDIAFAASFNIRLIFNNADCLPTLENEQF